MKKRNIETWMFYCLLTILGGILLASLFTACNVYTDEEIEIIRCPQIQDTIQIPDWEGRLPHDGNALGH